MKKIIHTAIFVLTAGTMAGQMNQKEFTSSGTFLVPAGVNLVTVEVIGAGGDGHINGAGGGGGGGYAKGEFAVTPGTSLDVTVAEGGNPHSVSEIKALGISATSGGNGFWYTVTPRAVGGGGSGGIGAGGTVNYTGGDGGGGYWTYFGGGGGGAAGPLGNGGNGGNSIVWTGACKTPGGTGGISGGAGDGGKGAGYTDDRCIYTDPSSNGKNYGGGGGSGNGNSSPASKGADGYVLIHWCPIAAPIGQAIQELCDSAVVNDLKATGSNIKWYDMAIGGAPLAGNTAIVDGRQYFASQEVDECESRERLVVTAILKTVEPVITVKEFLLSTEVSYATYQWLKNDVPIAGATQQEYTVTENGFYTVLVSDANGCLGLSESYEITNIDNDTGLESIKSLNGQIKVFPNPTRNIVYIQSPVPLNTHVTDITGKTISKNNKLILQMTNYKAGVYLLHLTNEQGNTIKTEKVIKY